MRILFIAAFGNTRCGERLYADLWVEALRKKGVSIDLWDGWYPAAKENGYLPDNAREYDIIHVNWGPANMGHYLPQHFPPGPKVSLFLHDVPPDSTTTLWHIADLRMAFVDGPGLVQLHHAVPEYVPKSQPPEGIIRVGVTGIRGDPGPQLVEKVCLERGWEISAPLWWSGGAFLSTEEEIERLASCHINVCWYQTSGRGKSMAAMFCCAARRPLVVSGSSMFSNLWKYPDEVFVDYRTHDDSGTIPQYYDNDLYFYLWNPTTYKKPSAICHDLGWSKLADKIKTLWEGL